MKRFGLSAEERIKSGKDFDEIFSRGKTIFSADKKIKAIFVLEKNKTPAVKIAVAVNKKKGQAVWRNRVKRLFKEAYRRNKEIVRRIVLKKNYILKIVFSPNNISEKEYKKIFLIDVMPAMIDILIKLKEKM